MPRSCAPRAYGVADQAKILGTGPLATDREK
jgi:hypothetical protein